MKKFKKIQRNADYVDYGSTNLNNANWRQHEEGYMPISYNCPVTDSRYNHGEGCYVSGKGLSTLLKKAFDTFEVRTGKTSVFPWNLTLNHKAFRHLGYMSLHGASEVIEPHARAAGWIKAAADLPYLRKVILKTQSYRGMGSPCTTIDLSVLWERFPSPGRLEHLIRKTRQRAIGILKCYGSNHIPAWGDIAAALICNANVGKAAIIVVAKTLASVNYEGKYHSRGFTYRSARQYLMNISSRNFATADNSDGVASMRAEKPVFSKLGVDVFRIRLTDEHGRYRLQFLAKSRNGRTFHSHWAYHYPDQDMNFEDFVKEAVRAWKQQQEMERQNSDLVAFLKGEESWMGKAMPLIYVRHSYAAGNCYPGTASWMQENGFSFGTIFVPGIALIKHLGDYRLRRVIEAARLELRETMDIKEEQSSAA